MRKSSTMVVQKHVKKAKHILKKNGAKGLTVRVAKSLYWRARNPIEKQFGRLVIGPEAKDYRNWRKKYEEPELAKRPKPLKYKPKISIITPVYNVEPKWLNKCIQSVLSQNYKNFEYCLYDDASPNLKTIECLKGWEGKDKRLKIKYGKVNQHISGSSNEALKMVTGEYVGLLDNDDELAPNALYEVAKLLNEEPKLKFIYSDEDKINERGKRFWPLFKPDWNPDLFLAQMYVSHFNVFKTSTIKRIGGFRKGYEGAQDYDLVLRFIEKVKTSEIGHIAKVLYHWRTLKSSTARGGEETKSYAYKAAKKAIQEYLDRNKIKATVKDGTAMGNYHVKREILGKPSVDIIIPFRDKVDYLKRVVDSILKKTEYQNYRIVLVDNESKEAATKKYLTEIKKEKKVKILTYHKPFNYSAVNNFAVNKSKADYVLLLNNDTSVINKEWLGAMLAEAQREEVGAVGAKLLFPNKTIQHAGIILGIGPDVAGHSHKGMRYDMHGYSNYLQVIRDFSAVTGACLLVSKKKYQEVGGLNEKELGVAYNDVDFCLKLFKKGYLNVYTPYAKLYHYESVTRGYEDPEKIKDSDPERYKRVVAEINYMKSKWGDLIKNDPNYNPNLTHKTENFRIRKD